MVDTPLVYPARRSDPEGTSVRHPAVVCSGPSVLALWNNTCRIGRLGCLGNPVRRRSDRVATLRDGLQRTGRAVVYVIWRYRRRCRRPSALAAVRAGPAARLGGQESLEGPVEAALGVPPDIGPGGPTARPPGPPSRPPGRPSAPPASRSRVAVHSGAAGGGPLVVSDQPSTQPRPHPGTPVPLSPEFWRTPRSGAGRWRPSTRPRRTVVGAYVTVADWLADSQP